MYASQSSCSLSLVYNEYIFDWLSVSLRVVAINVEWIYLVCWFWCSPPSNNWKFGDCLKYNNVSYMNQYKSMKDSYLLAMHLSSACPGRRDLRWTRLGTSQAGETPWDVELGDAVKVIESLTSDSLSCPGSLVRALMRCLCRRQPIPPCSWWKMGLDSQPGSACEAGHGLVCNSATPRNSRNSGVETTGVATISDSSFRVHSGTGHVPWRPSCRSCPGNH